MALLEIGDLRKHYPTGEKALRGVDVVVEKREIVALLGLSGSGKSTLLRCINRLVDPDSGRVVLDGVEITALGKHDLRRARVHMGMIFQEFNLVDRLSVLENVLSVGPSARPPCGVSSPGPSAPRTFAMRSSSARASASRTTSESAPIS